MIYIRTTTRKEADSIKMEQPGAGGKPSPSSEWTALIENFRKDLPRILEGNDPHFYPTNFDGWVYDDFILANIAKMITGYFNLPEDSITSPPSDKSHVELMCARRVFVYIARKYSTRSLSNIGQYIHRDHSSVASLVRTTTRKISQGDGMTIKAIQFITSRMVTMPVGDAASRGGLTLSRT
ncbi:MAG: helix-turn-helix domain-containing protein [bacterium]